VSTVFRGTIGPRARARSFRVVAGPGELTAELQFTGSGRLTLALTPARGGKPLARVAGPSPLQFRTSVPAGTYLVRVSGRSATFVVNVTHALPADRD
jgi:hypothetical protein